MFCGSFKRTPQQPPPEKRRETNSSVTLKICSRLKMDRSVELITPVREKMYDTSIDICAKHTHKNKQAVPADFQTNLYWENVGNTVDDY